MLREAIEGDMLGFIGDSLEESREPVDLSILQGRAEILRLLDERTSVEELAVEHVLEPGVEEEVGRPNWVTDRGAEIAYTRRPLQRTERVNGQWLSPI